ncbi:MAG: DNA polymerase III subunit gamma/tau [Aerococcus sp.]|nr:DNA polymerase III subunit gamma/tau [Aerococcus sp.]
MSYQALYRKWRPQQFSDIVGQEAVSKTLRNAIRENKTSHAYLFTGPRGTGKTSAAKIFAKAVNCPNQVDGEPCNTCPICTAITEGTLADVIEIDAASNNGVEEIRDIRDKVRYAPTEAENKVYIIDEVHMLSSGAFNALLKTLEEPPANVIFILATTEVHKIPATVISRTQRFDFKRITSLDLIARMAYILEQEAVSYEPEALEIIARTANGGMRDALSVLDQVLSFSDDMITAEMARQLTGTLSNEQKITYETQLYQQETAEALKTLRAILADGKEASRFIEELLLFTRDVMMAKEVGAKQAVDLMPNYGDEFYALAKAVSVDFLYQVMQTFKNTQSEIRFSMQPNIYLEVATIRLSQRGMADPVQTPVASQPMPALPDQVAQTIQQLQQEVQSLKSALTKSGGRSATKSASATTKRSTKTFEPQLGLIYQTLAEATNTDRNHIVAVWGSVIEQLPNVQKALLQQTEPVAASSTHFVVSFQYQTLCQQVATNPEIQQAVAEKIQQQTGHPGKMLVLTDEQWHDARQTYVKAYREGKQAELMAGNTAEEETSKQTFQDTVTSETEREFSSTTNRDTEAITSSAAASAPKAQEHAESTDIEQETVNTLSDSTDHEPVETSGSSGNAEQSTTRLSSDNTERPEDHALKDTADDLLLSEEEAVAKPLIDLFGKDNVTLSDD